MHRSVVMFIFAGILVLVTAMVVNAATLVQWNFDSGNTTPSSGSGTASAGSGLIVPSIEYPTGNPSSGLAWSRSGWGDPPEATDYFQFDFSTQGDGSVSFMFDDRASGTGPTGWELFVGTGTCITFDTVTTGAAHGAFSATPMNVIPLPLSTDDQPTVCVRLVGTGASGSTGTWRLDNVTVSATPLAVTLADFSASPANDHILITWETASELNNAGFNLYRSTTDAAPEELLTYVPSQAPGSQQGASYQWQDRDVAPGDTWWYWLEDIDLNGATTLHGPVSATMVGPTAVGLVGMEADGASHGGAANGWVVAVLIALVAVTAASWIRWRGGRTSKNRSPLPD